MREVLAAWGQPEVTGLLSGGNRNTVLEIQLGPRRLVARRSRRTPASLDWEADLLEHLASHGLRVPAVVPSLDGHRHVSGLMVQTWLDGRPPGAADWRAVAAFLRHLHQLTTGWPQRPGFASTRELLTADCGGDVDLTRMPADAVADCRLAWSRLSGAEAVVHGDPGPANIRISDAGPGLLDWDEARVDRTDLDLAQLPGSDLPPSRLPAAQAAVTAWEAANGWIIEPPYAQHQLNLLRAGGGLTPR
ncbi:MAG: phosphotransferase enzyme family protein [Streptosporangiaceae bacterium]